MIKILFVLFVSVSLGLAGDDRFGFCTHFGASGGWSTSLNMPLIASTGAGFIRDDFSWAASEKSPGVYKVDAQDQGWLDSAAANGLKSVAILNANGLYNPDPWNQSAAAKFCAWLAVTEGLKLSAIEIVNEPNNVKLFQGAAGLTKYVGLINAIYAAVHAVSPLTQVIGSGFQGQTILGLLPQVHMDGVVVHPYSRDFIPEHTDEGSFQVYDSWVQVLKSKTGLPVWETEWGISYQLVPLFTPANQEDFLARRLLEAEGLGVEHTFIYEFKNNGPETFGVWQNPGSIGVVKTIIQQLAGVTPSGLVTVNSVADGDQEDVKAYVFHDSSKTVVTFWSGNKDPRTPPAVSTCSLSFPVMHPGAHAGSYVLNLISKAKGTVNSYRQVGNQFTVNGVHIDANPRLIVLP